MFGRPHTSRLKLDINTFAAPGTHHNCDKRQDASLFTGLAGLILVAVMLFGMALSQASAQASPAFAPGAAPEVAALHSAMRQRPTSQRAQTHER